MLQRGRSHYRRIGHTPRYAHPRSRPRPITWVVERACTDPKDHARDGAFGDPFHWHATRRRGNPYDVINPRTRSDRGSRQGIADKTFYVTNLGGAECDLGTDELLVTRRRRFHCGAVAVCLQESAFLGEHAATPQKLNRCGK